MTTSLKIHTKTSDPARMLIVESDRKQAEVYGSLLREICDSKADVCQTTPQAIEFINQNNYQIVILDLDTTTDALATLERIKGIYPNSSIIIVARYANVEESVRFMRAGAEDYLKKPIDLEKLKQTMKRCLDRKALYANDLQITSYVNLINACQIISASMDEQRIFETVMAYLKRETDCAGIALYKLQSDRWDRISTVVDSNVEVIDVTVEWSKVLLNCLEEKAAYKVVPRSVIGPELLVFNFRCIGETDYFVVCAAPSLHRNIEELALMFKMLAVQTQLSGKNIQNYRGFRDLLYQDDATGLYNARYLAVALDRAFERQSKENRCFSVLFLDVDHFKSVNDTHGHIIGTRLLQEIGSVIRDCVRKEDVICRYGGDEFVIILPGANIDQSFEIAERIRQQVEQRSFLPGEDLGVKLTVSIGVASCPQHAQSKKDVMVAADMAMYHAKKSRRNFVHIAPTLDEYKEKAS